MSGATFGQRWEDAAQRYAAAATIAGLSPATVDLRVRALRRFADGLEVAPWELTKQEYRDRLAQLPQSPYRAALRSFYRWAIRAEHIDADPTVEPSRLPQITPAPPAWESALSEFESGLRAQKYQEGTIGLRVRLVRLFAVGLEVAPFQVTWDLYRTRLEALQVGQSTRDAYRTALRAFYRWAARTGRVEADPTVEPTRRTEVRKASVEWEAELLPFQRYLRALGHTEGSTRQTVSSVRRVALILGPVHPFRVSTDDLLEALATKSSWQAETRRHHVNSLRSFYRWAKLVGRSKKNPAKAIPAVRRSIKIVEPASEASLAEAIAKASPDERIALRLAAELGLRRAEVAAVHSIDLTGRDGDWWLLVHGKGNKQRRLPVPDNLAHALRGRGPGFAFPGQDNGHVSAGYLGNRISALLPPGVTMHKLRHRFATLVYGVDHDVFTLQKLLGHASPATTERYVRIQDDRGRRLVEFATAER